jgi:hypothetical protein
VTPDRPFLNMSIHLSTLHCRPVNRLAASECRWLKA